MTPDALNRAARQIAVPQIGFEGQERIARATVVVVGDDLTCEIVARVLAAAGVGKLRLVRRTGALSTDVAAALSASNPLVAVETWSWPLPHRAGPPDASRFRGGGSPPGHDGDIRDEGTGAGADSDGTGPGWLEALSNTDVVVRSGFDDDPMLRAAVRLGLPAVVARGRDDSVELVSFRRHGPCPHAPLDGAEQLGVPPQDGPGAVVAGHVAAAEALVLLAGANTGVARARRTRIPMSGTAAGEPQATDIPWTPECFACGGSGTEMSFS